MHLMVIWLLFSTQKNCLTALLYFKSTITEISIFGPWYMSWILFFVCFWCFLCKSAWGLGYEIHGFYTLVKSASNCILALWNCLTSQWTYCALNDQSLVLKFIWLIEALLGWNPLFIAQTLALLNWNSQLFKSLKLQGLQSFCYLTSVVKCYFSQYVSLVHVYALWW